MPSDDFPPPHVVAGMDRVACDVATERGLHFLAACATVSPEGAAWAAYDWLQTSQAGLPYLALTEQSARDDARFWAETATPAELECYALAAMTRLSGASSNPMFASRQIKRLMGALWRRMAQNEKAAFLEWAQKEQT